MKKSINLKYLKKHKISKSNVLNAYRNMLVLVHFKKIFFVLALSIVEILHCSIFWVVSMETLIE